MSEFKTAGRPRRREAARAVRGVRGVRGVRADRTPAETPATTMSSERLAAPRGPVPPGQREAPARHEPTTGHGPMGGLHEPVDRWVREGFITPEQAQLILRDEESRQSLAAVSAAPAPGPTSLLAEALGYLGGVLILVACSILTAVYWADLPIGVRLGIAGGAAIVLLAGGWAVPEPLTATSARLRAVLWLLSTAAVPLFLGVLGADGFGWRAQDVALLAASGTASYAALLWIRYPSVLQHVALFVALGATVGVATAHLPDADSSMAGLALWGFAVVWMCFGWGGLLSQRELGLALGAIGTIVGALMTTTVDWGYLLALATVAALLTLAVLFRDLVLLAVGAIGSLQTLPAVVDRFFPETIGPPLALLAAGAVLVAIAWRIARRSPSDRKPQSRDYSTGTLPPALWAAGAVAGIVTSTVLLLAVV